MHYLTCPHPKLKEARKGAVRTLSVGLRSINIYPGCKAMILKGLLTIFEHAVQCSGIPTLYKDILLHKAASNQHNLGHHTMHKGFIAKSWETIQSEWCRKNGSQHNKKSGAEK